MAIVFKKWDSGSMLSTLAAVAIVWLFYVALPSRMVSASSLVAACLSVSIMRYLHQCGYSIMSSSWRVRLVLLTVFVLAILLGNAAAVMLGVR